jgi:hypothetical protein
MLNSSQLSDESFKEFAVRLVGFLRHWLEREEIGNDFAKFAYVHAEFVYISQTYLVYVHSVLASLALKGNLLQYVLLSDK